MKLTLNRRELKEAVAGLGRIVSTKATLPILGCVRLEVNGQVIVQATDLEQTAAYRFTDASHTGSATLVLPLQTLKELSKGNDREPVEIQADNPETVTVVNHVGSLAVRKVIAGTPLDEWPVTPEPPAVEPVAGFLETYRKLVPFASSDVTRSCSRSLTKARTTKTLISTAFGLFKTVAAMIAPCSVKA